MPIYAFTGSRKELLDSKRSYYDDSYDIGDAKNALANILRIYCRVYPLSMPANVEPTPEEIAAALVDDQVAVEGPELDPTNFTAEEWKEVLAERELERAALVKLQGQLQRWFSYRYIKAHGLLKLNASTRLNHPFANLFRRLEGTEQKPRQRSAINVWKQGFSRAVEEVARATVERGGASMSRGLVGVRARVAKEMFDALSKEDRDHYQMLALEEHKASLTAYEANKTLGPSTTPEARQSCISSLTRVVQPLLDAIVEATGWRVSLIAGGPEPATEGRMSMIMLHSGTTIGDVKMDWGRFEHRRIPEVLMPMFGDYLRKCYSVAECQGRTLSDPATATLDAAAGESAPEVASTCAPPPTAIVTTTPLPTSPTPVPASASPIPSADPVSSAAPVSSAPSPAPRSRSRSRSRTPSRSRSRSRSPSPPVHSQPSSPRPSPTLSPPPAVPTLPKPSTPREKTTRSRSRSPRRHSHPSSPAPSFPRLPTPPEKRAAQETAPGEEGVRGRKKRRTGEAALVPPDQRRSTRGGNAPSPSPTPPSPSQLPSQRRSTRAVASSLSTVVPASTLSSNPVNPSSAIAHHAVASWFSEAMDLFVKGSLGIGADGAVLGPSWLACLEAYSLFQRNHGFGTGADARLPTLLRPSLVKDWISRGRTRNKAWRPKNFVVKDFRLEFTAWWTSLQPEWRVENGVVLVERVDGDWSGLVYPGVNGLLSVVAGLFFWGQESQDTAWRAAVDDCTTVFNRLATTS